MRVTKLKAGYRIHLTDGEFEALDHLLRLGLADIEDDEDGQTRLLTAAGKTGMKRIQLAHCFGFRIADNRRDG
jgi:hypothetical protein